MDSASFSAVKPTLWGVSVLAFTLLTLAVDRYVDVFIWCCLLESELPSACHCLRSLISTHLIVLQSWLDSEFSARDLISLVHVTWMPALIKVRCTCKRRGETRANPACARLVNLPKIVHCKELALLVTNGLSLSFIILHRSGVLCVASLLIRLKLTASLLPFFNNERNFWSWLWACLSTHGLLTLFKYRLCSR